MTSYVSDAMYLMGKLQSEASDELFLIDEMQSEASDDKFFTKYKAQKAGINRMIYTVCFC